MHFTREQRASFQTLQKLSFLHEIAAPLKNFSYAKEKSLNIELVFEKVERCKREKVPIFHERLRDSTPKFFSFSNLLVNFCAFFVFHGNFLQLVLEF